MTFFSRKQAEKANKLYLKHLDTCRTRSDLEETIRQSVNSYIENDKDYKNSPAQEGAFRDGVNWTLKKLNKWDLIKYKKEPVFLFVFHNGLVNEMQSFKVQAKNKHVARHLFWDKYGRTRYTIELIEKIYPLEGSL